MKRQWDVKAMHKLMVMSATYRQASKAPADLVKRDPFNRLYARGPRFRMDAEMVRDNALSISGLLNRKIGGPSVFPYQPNGVWFNPYSGDKWVTSTHGDQHRRGLYTFCRRTAPYAEFSAFDAPSREICTERRSRTNTPLQALAVLNDKVYVEASAALARRMTTEVTGGPAERAAYGFRLCTARTPTTAERDLLLKLYAESLAKYRKDAPAALAMAKNGGDRSEGRRRGGTGGVDGGGQRAAQHGRDDYERVECEPTALYTEEYAVLTTACVEPTLAEGVAEVLHRHNAEAAFQTACEVARSCFPAMRSLHARLRDDPDVPGRILGDFRSFLPQLYDQSDLVGTGTTSIPRRNGDGGCPLELNLLFGLSISFVAE